MSNVVESEDFSEEANSLMQKFFDLCVGHDVEMAANVLANALVIVVKSADGDLERLRTFMNNMIDTHIAADRQKDGQKKS